MMTVAYTFGRDAARYSDMTRWYTPCEPPSCDTLAVSLYCGEETLGALTMGWHDALPEGQLMARAMAEYARCRASALARRYRAVAWEVQGRYFTATRDPSHPGRYVARVLTRTHETYSCRVDTLEAAIMAHFLAWYVQPGDEPCAVTT